ncbi:hypothetical protein DPEC_G00005230 [Dallia pectoralis]|uniref:Uncharacterized protein n=1 Tax=Dallia pectoralis TaxID=75939 RepID=A0ACC2HK38_DALPE|nr:hypothetical protein DPEC_G00005230 [Dallia pectoralis]
MNPGFALLLPVQLATFWACTGESTGPCRPGFSQTSYSWLIPRDVLQGQNILKETLHLCYVRMKETVGGTPSEH